MALNGKYGGNSTGVENRAVIRMKLGRRGATPHPNPRRCTQVDPTSQGREAKGMACQTGPPQRPDLVTEGKEKAPGRVGVTVVCQPWRGRDA